MAEIIQPMAFTVNPSSTLCTGGVLELAIPQPWVHRLAELQGELRDRTDEPNTPGWRSLSAVIATLIPHLLTAPSYIAPPLPNRPARGGSAPWLLAHEPVSLRIIHAIILAWLEKHYRDCPSYQRVRAQLPVDDLLWETMTLTLSDATLASKTANPSPLAFRALPALLADRLVRAGGSVPIVGERRQLVRMPVRAGGYGAELATWPPVYLTEEIDGKTARFGMSYFFSLTLQTLAGEPEPRVHVHIGRRRWHARPLLTRDGLYLRGGRTSVYLRPTQPWLGLPRSSSFTLTQLVRVPQDGRWEPAWADLVPEIVTRLGIHFPMAADLARDPDRWIQGFDGVEAAIVARTPRNHPIGIGVDLLTRSELLGPLAEAFGDDAHLVPTMHREPIHRNRKPHPLQRDLRELDANRRLEGFVDSVLRGQKGANAIIEVYWQSQEVRDWLVFFIKHLLCEARPPLMDRAESAEASDPRHAGSQDEEALSEGEADGANEHDPAGSVGFLEAEPSRPTESEVAARLSGRHKPARTRQPLPAPPAAPDSCVIDLPGGGELRIVTRQVGAWAAPFEATERTVASVRTRTQERMEQIVAELPQATEPRLALIELPNYRAGKLRTQFGRTRDPKGAIRLGMARVRRTSQFITPPGDGAAPVPVRAEKAVRDGLRHLGYLPVPIGFSNQSGPALPPGLMVAAVWSIRLTKKTAFVPVYLPVVVVMEIASHQIHAWLPDGRGLRPYRDALLDLTLLDREMVSNKQRPRALADLQQFLTQSLPVAEGANDLVILVVAQNARATWKGISNKDTLFDHLRFESNAHPKAMRGETGRIRLIRLRTADGHETPAWFIPGRDDTEDQERRIQSTQGLWRVGAGRNFYDIAAKPVTAGTKRKKGVQANPKEHHAIPSILEIVPIITQDDEEVRLWPRAVDQWRRMSYLTNDMTLLPLPLHLAEAMEEYAQVIGSWLLPDALVDLLEEDEEDEEDEGAGV